MATLNGDLRAFIVKGSFKAYATDDVAQMLKLVPKVAKGTGYKPVVKELDIRQAKTKALSKAELIRLAKKYYKAKKISKVNHDYIIKNFS